MKIDLNRDELALLIEALDSHEYWQLSDEFYRRDGEVVDPGSDNEDNRRAIRKVRALSKKLSKL